MDMRIFWRLLMEGLPSMTTVRAAELIVRQGIELADGGRGRQNLGLSSLKKSLND